MIEERIQNSTQQKKTPKHVAIIMDGNGRWAQQRKLPRVSGHYEGIKSVREIVKASTELGIEILTLYTFSSENWRRPRQEVSALMKLLVKTLRNEVEELLSQNVQIRSIGKLDDLPELPRCEILEAIQKTEKNSGLILNLALSYSSRNEILRAVQSIVKNAIDNNCPPSSITEEQFSSFLYTDGLRDPDLLIRTSGESRISNFLLWQLAYTEIFFTKTLWPDFRKEEFLDAIDNYQHRERRFGLVSEQL